MTFPKSGRSLIALRAVSALFCLTLLPISTMAAQNPTYRNYRRKAENLTAHIQKTLYDAEKGLYRPATPMPKDGLPYEFMWGNGVQLTALVTATKYDPKTYRPILYAFANGLKRYWDKDAPIPGFDAYWSGPNGDDKYYDDNEWLVLGFVEAYEVTKDPFFLDWARNTQDFVLSGWDDKLDGGIYWYQDHKSKNTCANAPAAASALRLYRVGRTKEDKEQLEWGLRIRHWTNAKLKDEDGLYWDNINLNGRIEKTKWTYNTVLPIRTDILLYQATNVKPYLAEARRMADASIEEWFDAETGAIRNPPRFTHLLCEAFLRLHDVTREPKYLNVVRRYADYVYQHGRNAEGGIREQWRTWETDTNPEDDRSLMIENASMARLFWLLAAYPDAGELVASAEERIEDREWDRAEPLLRQAVETAPDSLKARVRFHEVLVRRKKAEEAEREAARLSELAQDPARRAELETLGWKPSGK